MLDAAPAILADLANAANAQTGMTAAQAILAVLGPIGTFLAGAATLFMRRHFRFMDDVTADLKARSAAELSRAKIDAEIAAELRLSRESREAHGKRLTELEDKLAAKIDGTKEEVSRRIEDSRFGELRDAVQGLSAEVAAGGVGTGLQMGGGDESTSRVRPRSPSVPEAPPSARGARVAMR